MQLFIAPKEFKQIVMQISLRHLHTKQKKVSNIKNELMHF
jgi:hypothetical protein